MKSNLTRRTIVTGAAIVASAFPVAVQALPGMGNPDAELLRLGVELEAIIKKWQARHARDVAHLAAYNARCEAAGFPRVEFGTMPDDEWRDYMDRRDAAGHIGEDQDERGAWEALNDRIYQLTERILASRPQTIAGLGVMARAISLSAVSEFWEDDHDSGPEHEARLFIEAVCAFAGVVPVMAESKA